MEGAQRQYGSPSSPADIALARRWATKPLIWTATIAECVAAGATIAAKLPAWSVSGVLVGIPLGALALYHWRRANHLRRQVEQLYHFDRQYRRFLSRWTFRESPHPGYWAATCHAEREFVALMPMRQITWNITRRSDMDMPFSGAAMRNRQATRSGDGSCIFHEPHKKGANLTFRIEFDPMLRPGELVDISYDIDVPEHKAGTLGELRKRPRPIVPPPGEADYSSTDVSFPIDEFTKEVIIPEALGSRHHGLQVLLRDNNFSQEADHISSNNLFTISKSIIDGAPAWHLRLRRLRPPLRANYRILWEPPPGIPATKTPHQPTITPVADLDH